jgi:hypothetical protein
LGYLRLGQSVETPGCAPFCHADAECAAGLHCDRVGRCRAQPVDLSLSPDGDPCDLSRDPVGGVSTQCRGACLPMLFPRDVGFCAACGIATCRDDCDCTAPFQCINGTSDGRGFCAPPDTTRGEHGTPCAVDASVDASSSDASMPDAAAD